MRTESLAAVQICTAGHTTLRDGEMKVLTADGNLSENMFDSAERPGPRINIRGTQVAWASGCWCRGDFNVCMYDLLLNPLIYPSSYSYLFIHSSLPSILSVGPGDTKEKDRSPCPLEAHRVVTVKKR